MKDKTYKINEIFYSIQGEGSNTGMPAIFVRFSGCNRECPFCDTKHKDYEELSVLQIVERIKAKTRVCKNVILTGGEPMLQVNDNLIMTLLSGDYNIFMETNGSIKIPAHIAKTVYITVSPKGNTRQYEADELKILVERGMTASNIADIISCYSTKQKIKIFLQPEFGSLGAVRTAISFIKQYPNVRLSDQMHKRLDIR